MFRQERQHLYLYENIAETYWKRKKMPIPHLLLSDYEGRNVWSRKGIVHWRGMNIVW